MRARQQLLRALITDIVVDVVDEARDVVLMIHWRGGQHSQLRVRKPRAGEHGCATSEDALAVMRSMAGRWSDEHIAASLNRMGLPTGQGKTWTAHRVSSVRRVRGIHAYLEVIYGLMDSCAAGHKSRVIVNLPPGYMKSMLISIIYVAWRLGVDPTQKFVCISYGDDLAHKHSASTRSLMLSPVYRAIFPGTVLDKRAEGWLTTTKGGYRYATAVHSDITGFRPNEIICDYPIGPEQGASELVKEKLRSWIASSVLTRFENNAKNLFILVMHRVAPGDLAGTPQAQGGYSVLSMPLVAEKRRVFSHGSGNVVLIREPGDFLHPGRMTTEQLDRLKREIAPHVFASQYQQRPTLGGSGMCTIGRLARYSRRSPTRSPAHAGQAPVLRADRHRWAMHRCPLVPQEPFLEHSVDHF